VSSVQNTVVRGKSIKIVKNGVSSDNEDAARSCVFVVSTVWSPCITVADQAKVVVEGIHFVLFPPSEMSLTDDSSKWQQFSAVVEVQASATITLSDCAITGKACHGKSKQKNFLFVFVVVLIH
jgi:hypothetical protein